MMEAKFERKLVSLVMSGVKREGKEEVLFDLKSGWIQIKISPDQVSPCSKTTAQFHLDCRFLP